MVDYLFEFGPVKSESPLEAVDIVSMQNILGVKFKPWESRLLLRLSREYKAEMHAARDREAPPPWPEAAKQWRWVKAWKSERNLDAFIKN